MIATKAYAVKTARQPLEPFSIDRREPGEHDVLIEILYCGVCHSDVHQVKNEWQNSIYPMVPGHEIVGRVSKVGPKVTKFAVGDLAGVGCMVDSCRTCPGCKKGLEQFCDGPLSFTYNSTERDRKTPTFGGYSSRITVDEAFTLKVKAGQPLERVAPLLCAGITTYSPLKTWGVSKGHRVAVLGLGGLGHMAIKYAASFGAEVTLLSSTDKKKADAQRLGAHDYIVTSDKLALAKATRRFDYIVDTVSAPHPVDRYLELLDTDGTMILLGVPETPPPLPAFGLISRRRRVVGSLIGGIAETQEMLDYSAAHEIAADVEVIPIQEINTAYERMLKSDVRYRFVIDNKTLG